MTPRSEPRDAFARSARLFVTGVGKLLQGFFESVDNSLFDMAEKAESNALQTHYFDGMRQVRKTRETVEQRFTGAIQTELKAFRSGRSESASGSQVAAPVTEDDMSLVGDTELEEKLAISEMVAKGENRLSRTLYALNQRLGASLRQPPPDEKSSPMGPAKICSAMQEAAAEFKVELPVLIVIYKLFDKEVLEQLESLYDSINEQLVKDGILPQLRAKGAAGRSASTTAAADAASGQQESADGSPVAPGQEAAPAAPAAPQASSAVEQQMLSTILELMAARRPPPAVSAPVIDQRDLLHALTVLQSEKPASAGENIKAMVLDQASRLTDTDAVGAAAADEDSIDLVAMLFEFILADRNLPPAMQVLLSRLQIPYIKVALLDSKLFASRYHPARQLLDDLADVCVGWSASADRGHKLYEKVEQIVDTVVNEFDDDLSLFEPLSDDLDAFMEKNRRRARIAEKRTTEATEGQQRLQTARRNAADTLAEELGDRELPSVVSEILGKPWANVLVLTQLRHGQDSEQFEQARSFVGDLIWTCEPKTSSADVAKLQSLLPDLSSRLRRGLEMVAYHEDEIRKVFKNLKDLYRSMVDSQYKEKLSLPSSAPPPPPVATMDLPEAVVPIRLPISGAADPDDDVFEELEDAPPTVPLEELEAALVEQVKSLETNSWFEFATEDGESLRAKLSWKSPITGNYLFVDQKGIKVADKPIAELVQELASGEAVALEAVPLFDRALQAISSRLQESADAEGESVDVSEDSS